MRMTLGQDEPTRRLFPCPTLKSTNAVTSLTQGWGKDSLTICTDTWIERAPSKNRFPLLIRRSIAFNALLQVIGILSHKMPLDLFGVILRRV